jgi:hypothetical protein
MKHSDYHLSWYIMILLVLTMFVGFRPATGQAEEKSVGKTSGSNQTSAKKPGGMSEMFKGTVVEVINAGRHIYVQIDTGKKRVWVAVPIFNGKPGDKVIVPPGIPIADFHSRNLNRDFKMMYFVGGIRRLDDNKSQ